jgi:hypothetical protein
MSWSPHEADKHIKGLDEKQKIRWASTVNGVLKDLIKRGVNVYDAQAKAIRIANSKFTSQVSFNPVIPPNVNFNLNFNGSGIPAAPIAVADEEVESADADIQDVGDIASDELWLTPDKLERLKNNISICTESGGDADKCLEAALDKMKRGIGFEMKAMKMMEDCPDCKSAMAECAAKGMSEEECKAVVMDKMKKEMTRKEFSELREVHEMEIFRSGTHNGDDFSEADLQEMADNFKALKEDLRPKLKITHAEDSTQESLAGLASYGDVVDVFIKTDSDGKKRLFAKLSRVPLEVYDWIKEGRFAERSIELYPEFKLGTKDDSPIYKNVLKAIALLGHQMPAVTGMTPIKLEERFECQGTACFREKVSETKILFDHDLKFRMFEQTIEFERNRIAV